jgi:hypothetical protein
MFDMKSRSRPSLVRNGHPSNPVVLTTVPRFSGVDHSEYFWAQLEVPTIVVNTKAAIKRPKNRVIGEGRWCFDVYVRQLIFIPPVSIFVMVKAAFVLPYP